MGDRTTVTLTVLAAQAETVEQLLPPGYESFEITEDKHLTSLVFHEINYGQLPFLKELIQAGIAYDSSWGNGSEYTSGTESIRFNPDGTTKGWEIYDESINPSLDELLKRIDDPVALRNYVMAHHEQVTVPALDDEQIEYGKRFRTAKLIAAHIN